MWDGERIRRVAAGNHGVIDKPTVERLGASQYFIKTQLLNGTWTRLHPAVYYLNVTPPTWRASVLAGVLAAGKDAVASHRTAGVLYGLDGVLGRPIEVTVPFDDRPVPDGVILHRTRRAMQMSFLDEIPITGIERTLLDLARFLPDSVLEKAVASAIRMHLTEMGNLDRAIGQFGGRGVTGTRRFRRVLAILADEGVTGSPSEVEFTQLIRRSPRIPKPVNQFEINLPDGLHAYPDFSWPNVMKLIEVDGYDAHSSPDQHHMDLIRQNLLMELGWEIRRFSARRIRREPQVVMAEIEKFLAA